MWKKGRGTAKWRLGDVETVVDAEHGPFDKLRAGSAEETHVVCHGYRKPRMVSQNAVPPFTGLRPSHPKLPALLQYW
jgi:hypothetical protein